MQKLNVNISIEIPSEYVLITELEYAELKSNELKGTFWTMKDLEHRTQRKQLWLKENVLYPLRFRKVLDAEYGGFVFYPKKPGQPWAFQASKMAAFLDESFQRIFNGQVE